MSTSVFGLNGRKIGERMKIVIMAGGRRTMTTDEIFEKLKKS